MNRKFLTYLSLLLVLLCTSATAFADTGGKRLADGEATVFDPPYYEGFDTEEALGKWTQYGNTPYSWTYLNYWGFKDSPCAYLNQSKKNTPCDNWIVSPGIRLKKGMTYAMSFFFHSTVSFDANLEVSYLTSPTDTASAVRILDVNTYENNTYEGELTPAADGVYYIAFHDKTKYHDNGTALRYASFIDEVKLTPKSNNASPAKVENLTCEPGTNPGFLYQQNTMRDALVAGINLNLFNKHCDRVKMANIAQLVNVLQAVILTEGEKMILTPTYHVFHMYQCHQDAELLDSHIETESIGLEEEYKVPNLNESVSLGKDGKIHITLNNLSIEKDYEIEGILAETEIKEVKGTILMGEMHAHNTFDAPDTVHTESFTGCSAQGNKLKFTIPACSVLHLEVTV